MVQEVGQQFLHQLVLGAGSLKLMSDELFSVDGTLIEAWASKKSFRPKNEPYREPPDDPSNPTVDIHGEMRSNETHESTTDADARMARNGNGKEARLAFAAHALMENRNGLVVDVRLTHVTGTAEREAALEMLRANKPVSRHASIGADKGFDESKFVAGCRELKETPNVAAKAKGSAADGRVTSQLGYADSQRVRKRIEENFGWMKTCAGLRKTRYRGLHRTRLALQLAVAAYNLLRIAKLTAA